MKVSGKSLALDITNIYRNVNNTVWGFVVFQTNRSNNQLKDNNTFDHIDVRNLCIEVGGERYPGEALNLEWDNDDNCLAYDVFHDYKRVNFKAEFINFKAELIPYIGKKRFQNFVSNL